MDSVALIYNRALAPKPPNTFERLVEAARERTEPTSDRWGLALPLLSPTHVYPFMDGYGGYLFGCRVSTDDSAAAGATSDGEVVCDPEDVGLANAGSVQGIQLVSDLYVQQRLLSEDLADRSQMHKRALQLFTEGRAAMLIDGPWVLPALRQAEIDFGVTGLPPLPGTSRPPRPLTIVHVLMANASTNHPGQVVELMNHIADRNNVASLTLTLNKAPARRDVLTQSQLEHVRDWRDQASQGVLLPPIPELDVLWTPWSRALSEAIPGLRPAQEAMDQASQEVMSVLGEQPADGGIDGLSN